MKQLLKTYQKRLTSLSGKNRSLLLLRLAQKQAIDLQLLDYACNMPAFDYIKALISGEKKFAICPRVDSRDAESNRGSHLLKALSRSDRLIQEERGAQDLYIGYPFVYGRMMDDTPIRAPLLFFPVVLTEEKGNWVLQQRKEAGISFNKSLLLAFSHFNDISLPDELLEEDFQDFPQEPKQFLTELYQKLEDGVLSINLGQEAFEEKLQEFENLSREQLLEKTDTGKLRAYPQAVLGLFPQAGSYLSPDYETLLSQAEEATALESLLLPRSQQAETDEPIQELLHNKALEEEALKAPYQLDAFQEQALHAVKAGRSVVVQGPPGSGKSQLICNLIADALAQKKNVLVVCQKKAALDVVYKRLDEKSLSDFTALVHDFRNDRAGIYQKIARNINLLDSFKSDNNSLDAIYLERNFLKYSREIDRITEELDDFRNALFDTSECGTSIKELYMSSDDQAPRIKLRQEYEYFKEPTSPEMVRKIRNYAKYAVKLDTPMYPWGERVSFDSFDGADLEDILETVKEVMPFYANKAWQVAEIISIEASLDDCEWIHDRAPQFRRLLELLGSPKVMEYFRHAIEYSSATQLWLSNRKQNVIAAFGEYGVESTLDKKQLSHALKVVDEAIEAQKKWHQQAKWKLFSKEKEFINDLIINNGMNGYDDALGILQRMIENRMNLEHQLSILSAQPWVQEMPENYRKSSFNEWFDLYLQALEAKEIYDSLRIGIKYLKLDQFTHEEMSQKIEKLLGVVEDVPAQRNKWQKYLTRKQITDLEEGKVSGDSLCQVLEKDFDLICGFDRIKGKIEPFEMSVLNKLREKVGKWDADTMVSVFENSLRVAWIHHIEAKYPVLRAVSSLELEDLEEQLREAQENKQELCLQIVLMHAKERMYEEVEYNRLNNMVTYRDLKHQVSKKRRIWSIRKLLEQFEHEIFDLMPCWMASPESVSAMFPMQKLFDLVIFDEASQCFAERGLPAIYRGAQTVIVGDNQQLPPFDLYHPRWEEESDNPALEVDSLLDLGCQYLEQWMLKGHYRSQSLELIGFSNKHFYQGQLRLLPHSETLMSSLPPIRYELVEGVWEKQTNKAEAKRVVQLLSSLMEKGETNIGIITFNSPQQQLIRDLIEESGIAVPEDVFIKNIEHVQGDERDIIIFSIGYAPTISGQMRLQFGSLSQLKGENRLNVAVTRSRKQIWVVASILPHQLPVEDTKHEGPKLLKAYLQYAYEVSEGKFKPEQKMLRYGGHWYLKRKVMRLSDGKKPVHDDFPFADLALLDPNEPSVMLTDDDLFHQGISAKELYAYTPLMLRNQGWRYKRMYSRIYWKDREQFKTEAKKFLN